MTLYTSSQWQVWNEIDEMGVLLNLPRLDGERNADYKQRLFDVFAHRADSSYLGLIYGITRELGLSLFKAMTITHVWAPGGGSFLADNPAVVFDETKCYVYNDTTDSDTGLSATLDRYEVDGSAYTLAQLASSIAGTGYFAVSIAAGVDPSMRAMTIYNQSSMVLVVSEELDTSGPFIDLRGERILPDSVAISSSNLRERVDTQADMKKIGQYYIDYEHGFIYTTEAAAPGSIIRYKYRNDNFEVWASPVIIHSLQSDDFKTKMFEQITGDDGEDTNGLPTALGSDIVNELMSMAQMSYSK